MKRRLLLFLTCLSLMAGVGYARTITGTVVEAANDEPVLGATVKCKGQETIGTSTDIDGKFTLNVPDNVKTLVVSYIGMVPQEVAVKDGMVVKLVENATKLDEVVVIGYGTTSKRKTTSAVTQIKASEIESVPTPNISQALAGRAAGLIVQQSGGGLDKGASISIRGGGTPLFVIDNIISEEREFNNLNPADIEEMTVLKDASATAVYGARAANGIIIVTTKRGKAGKVNVDYTFNYTFSSPADLPKKLDAYSAAVYQNRGYLYDGLDPVYSDSDLQKFLDGSDPRNFPNTDWQKETMRSYAPEMRHLLTITGGSDVVRSYTALSYYDQESIYRTNAHNYKRYNARTNIDVTLKEIGLRVNTGLEAYLTESHEPMSNSYYYIWSHIQNTKPMQVAKNPMGQPFAGTPDNPLRDLSTEGGYVKSQNTNVRGTINAQWDLPWVKGLRLQGIASYSILSVRSKNWNKQAPGYSWEGEPTTITPPSLSKTANFYNYYNTQLLANYNRDFGKHNVEATLGIEASGSSYDQNSLSRSQYVLDVDQIGAGPVDTQKNSAENGVQWRRASVIFRAHYDYAAKYMVEFALRHDGTDNLPKGRRWGTFYSGSLGWMVSEENFWKDSKLADIVNMFKLRSSYGEIGLDNVARYAYLTSYGLNNTGAYLGGQWYQTFSEGALPSPDLSWYTQRDFNVGFDFGMLNNAISGSVDYFYKSTKGYLASPSNVGYTSPLGLSLPMVKSDGESRRRGVDFSLMYNGRIGEVSYSVGGNFTYYDDRWNINPNESETSLKNPYKRSTQVGAYTGNYYKNLGYYTDYEDVLNSPKLNGSANIMAGDLKFWDFNGDGKIDGDDQYRQGSGTSPNANYGINADVRWRGFNLSMLWQGATNYNIYVDGILQGGNSNYLPVIYEYQTDIWAPDNTGALYPRQHVSAGMTGGNNFVRTNFWLVDAKYIRLKNLTVGYDFKHKLLKTTNWLSKCYLSVTGYNLLTFSPAKKWGFDPESGAGSGYTYPVARIWTVSLNIGF